MTIQCEKSERKYLDKNGFPKIAGVYLVRGVWGSEEPEEIEVYRHPIKGLCCFAEDFGSSGTEGVSDSTDCHVSVQCTGLEFIKRVRNLTQK